MIKRYDTTGVIIGRFQIDELHDGHKELIETTLSKHVKVIVFLGVSASLGGRENPLDYPTREKMILKDFPDVIVQALPDMSSNLEWSRNLDKLIRIISPVGKVCMYGGRDSFIPFYKGGFETKEVDPTLIASATERRTQLSQHIIESKEFRIGAIYSAYQRYDSAMLAVDAAIIRAIATRPMLLLAKKPNEKLWRFPGGFVDTSDKSSEEAVLRETKEETGIIGKDPKFVCNVRVDDWRYRGKGSKIFTNFYLVQMEDDKQIPKADDDISEVWFENLEDITPEMMVQEHGPLLENLKVFIAANNFKKPAKA